MSVLRNAHKRSLSEDSTPPPTPLFSQKKSPSSLKRTPPSSPSKQAVQSQKSKLAKLSLLKTSPWGSFDRPTERECREVNELLESVHGRAVRPGKLVDSESARAGCGETLSVLDALVRTILSQNTTSKNSTAAKESMDTKYGRKNYRAILESSVSSLAKTIHCGGLGLKKAGFIMGILKTLDEEEKGEGELSLDYVRGLGDEEAMRELTRFGGVGVKTAACVLLFCLGRECFAVDTHVLRIALSLGWLPPKATRDQAFQHLDLKIPPSLKYSLHSLLVRHGRGCEKCSAGSTTMDFVNTCPIDHLVTRAVKKRSTKKAKIEVLEEDEEDEESFEEVLTTPTKSRKAVLSEEIKKEPGSHIDLPKIGMRRSGRGNVVVVEEGEEGVNPLVVESARLLVGGAMHGLE